MLSKTKVAQPLETPLGVGVVWPTVPAEAVVTAPSHLTAEEVAEADRCGWKEAEERTQLWDGPEPFTGSLEASAIATSTWCLGVFQPLLFKLGTSS